MIRPASSADAVSLAALAQLVWLDTYAFNGIRSEFADYVQQTFTVEQFVQWINDPAQHVLVAERDGHLLGYARLALNSHSPLLADDMAELTTLYVMPRFAGQGIGRNLLHAALQQACVAAKKGLWLTVYHGNARALEFYRRQRLTECGQTHFQLGDEAHLNLVFAMYPESAGTLVARTVPISP